MMGEAMMILAGKVKARAEVIAPVGDEFDKHAGRYKDQFKTRLGMNFRHNRVEAVVYNDSREALDVEKGNSNTEGQHVLMRALDILRRA